MIDIQLRHVGELNCTNLIFSFGNVYFLIKRFSTTSVTYNHANDAKVPAKKNLISMLFIKIICISC